MRALQRSIGLIPALLLAVTLVTTIGAEAQNPAAFTSDIRPIMERRSTDDFGYKALEQPVSAHDLRATILHLLGMDHTKLTYRFSGRDMRLTDVAGTLIPRIVGRMGARGAVLLPRGSANSLGPGDEQ